MKKALFLIIAILTTIGCSKENEEEKLQEPYKMSYGEFCHTYFAGYLVNDTTGLVNLTKEVKYNQDGTTYLVGTKEGKLWVAQFDTGTKKCIKEYISHDDFPLDFTYDLGYGKSEVAHMDYLNVHDFFDTSKGFACSIQSQYSLYTVYIFNSTHTKYYLSRYYDVYKGLSKWYNETYLMKRYSNNGDNNISCLDEEGNILFDGYIDSWVLSCSYIPINLEEYIYIDYNDDYIFMKNGNLQDNNIPSKRLNLFSRVEGKELFTCEFENIENNILKFKLILTSISGDAQIKNYKVNINTFELEE